MIRDTDAVKPLVDYLEKNLKKGYKIDELKWALVSQKHSKIEIEKAIKVVQAKNPSARDEPKQMPMQEIRQETIILPPKKGFWGRMFGSD